MLPRIVETLFPPTCNGTGYQRANRGRNYAKRRTRSRLGKATIFPGTEHQRFQLSFQLNAAWRVGTREGG